MTRSAPVTPALEQRRARAPRHSVQRLVRLHVTILSSGNTPCKSPIPTRQGRSSPCRWQSLASPSKRCERRCRLRTTRAVGSGDTAKCRIPKPILADDPAASRLSRYATCRSCRRVAPADSSQPPRLLARCGQRRSKSMPPTRSTEEV
jgi:hypothetical protein